jgi:hypothetical protein
LPRRPPRRSTSSLQRASRRQQAQPLHTCRAIAWGQQHKFAGGGRRDARCVSCGPPTACRLMHACFSSSAVARRADALPLMGMPCAGCIRSLQDEPAGYPSGGWLEPAKDGRCAED